MRASEVARLQQHMRSRTARLARAGDMARRGLPSALNPPPSVHRLTDTWCLVRPLDTYTRPPPVPPLCRSSLTRSPRPVRPSYSGCAHASSCPPVAGVRTATLSDASLVSCRGKWWCSAVERNVCLLAGAVACLRSRALWWFCLTVEGRSQGSTRAFASLRMPHVCPGYVTHPARLSARRARGGSECACARRLALRWPQRPALPSTAASACLRMSRYHVAHDPPLLPVCSRCMAARVGFLLYPRVPV